MCDSIFACLLKSKSHWVQVSVHRIVIGSVTCYKKIMLNTMIFNLFNLTAHWQDVKVHHQVFFWHLTGYTTLPVGGVLSPNDSTFPTDLPVTPMTPTPTLSAHVETICSTLMSCRTWVENLNAEHGLGEYRDFNPWPQVPVQIECSHKCTALYLSWMRDYF